MTVKILNLINQAKPVATTPRYKSETVDSKEGFNSQGFSKIIDNGSKKITDHIVVDVVTFSFPLIIN